MNGGHSQIAHANIKAAFTLCCMLRQLLCQLLLARLHLTTGCTATLFNRCATPTPRHNDVTYVIAVCCSTIFVCVFWEYYGTPRHGTPYTTMMIFIAATTAAAVAIIIKRHRRRRQRRRLQR